MRDGSQWERVRVNIDGETHKAWIMDYVKGGMWLLLMERNITWRISSRTPIMEGWGE